jgi:hypothetical protein
MAAPANKQYYNISGINSYLNPLLPQQDGALVHAVNVDSLPMGGKRKRFGYGAYLNNPDSAQVNSMWQFQKNNGTQFWNYRASGSKIYYSIQGTGDWTVANNGTIANGGHVSSAILADTMIIGDGVGSTRHTANGTTFTDTVLAPVAPYVAQYQGRIHAQGTASVNFYSSANDPTNWQTSGTSDSSSFNVPGAGKLGQGFVSADRLILPKNSGEMYRWDGYSLVDLATTYGPSSPYSVAETEGYRIYANRYGIMGYSGGNPELLSNAIQRQFYNTTDFAIQGSVFGTIPAAIWYYNYFAAVGSVTDDFTNRTMNNAIIKYDFQKNEFLNWNFANPPTAFFAGLDSDGNRNLYFGDSLGNTFVMEPQWTADSNATINAEMVFVFHYGYPEYEKKWNFWRGVFNPGCQARVQVACSNTYTYERLIWYDLGDVSDGVAEFRFPGLQSRLLFVRILESSTDDPFFYYGSAIAAEVKTIT